MSDTADAAAPERFHELGIDALNDAIVGEYCHVLKIVAGPRQPWTKVLPKVSRLAGLYYERVRRPPDDDCNLRHDKLMTKVGDLERFAQRVADRVVEVSDCCEDWPAPSEQDDLRYCVLLVAAADLFREVAQFGAAFGPLTRSLYRLLPEQRPLRVGTETGTIVHRTLLSAAGEATTALAQALWMADLNRNEPNGPWRDPVWVLNWVREPHCDKLRALAKDVRRRRGIIRHRLESEYQRAFNLLCEDRANTRAAGISAGIAVAADVAPLSKIWSCKGCVSGGTDTSTFVKMTIEQIAQRMECDRATVSRMLSAGSLRHIHLTKQHLRLDPACIPAARRISPQLTATHRNSQQLAQ